MFGDLRATDLQQKIAHSIKIDTIRSPRASPLIADDYIVSFRLSLDLVAAIAAVVMRS